MCFVTGTREIWRPARPPPRAPRARVDIADMPFDTHTLTKPLKKAAHLEQSSWQLSCKADFTECFGELTV